MDAASFIQGMIIGLTLAVPIGPLSLVCIHRSITDGRLHGIISGLGVAAADSFYAAVAILGLTVISGIILSNQGLFRALAGFILVLIGIHVFFSHPSGPGSSDRHESYHKDFLSLLTVALANPLTLIFYAAVLPGLGMVVQYTGTAIAASFVAGVFSGSAAWWIVLCGSLGSLRSSLHSGHLLLINRISGAMVLCFGIFLLLFVIVFSGTFPHF